MKYFGLFVIPAVLLSCTHTEVKEVDDSHPRIEYVDLSSPIATLPIPVDVQRERRLQLAPQQERPLEVAPQPPVQSLEEEPVDQPEMISQEPSVSDQVPPVASVNNTIAPLFVDFDNESFVFKAKEQKLLESKLDAENDEHIHFFVVGHSHGKSALGVEHLSHKRASEVAKWLKSQGIPAEKIHTMSSWSYSGDSLAPPKGAIIYRGLVQNGVFSLAIQPMAQGVELASAE